MRSERVLQGLARAAGPFLALVLVAAAPAPSVLVRTEAPHQGSLPRIVVGYGTARPAPDGTVSLNVQHAGTVTWLNVVPGQRVAADAALATVSAAPAVVAQYHQAQTALALARSERAHMAQLRAQQLATRDQLARADTAVTDAESAIGALVREGGADPSQTLRAPFAGVVTAVAVTQGQAVAATTSLLSLRRANALRVVVGIDPAVAAAVRPGQAARLEPLDGGAQRAGTVAGVGGMLDPGTHLVEVNIALRRRGAAGAPGDPPLGGASFRANIRVGSYHGWIVPRDAVLRDATGAYLFQVTHGHAARVAVRVLGEVGGRTAVAGPITPDLPLVVSGNYQLAPGMAVRRAPAATARSGPAAGAAAGAAAAAAAGSGAD